MKKQRVLYINTRPPVLSNKEMLMQEREQEHFTEEEAETLRRNLRLTDRISNNPRIRK